VVKVADGDTVTVLLGRKQHRVRLQGIDAPERGQPYGKASGRSPAGGVAGKEVRVEYDKRDRYGRIVGVVWVVPPGSRCEREPGCPKTLDAGLYQLTVGKAWWYRQYAGEQSAEDRRQYEFAESEARAKRAGLWQEPDPVPPWDWRRRQRAPTASTRSDWCVSRRYCRDMANCAEARRAFTKCGRTWPTRALGAAAHKAVRDPQRKFTQPYLQAAPLTLRPAKKNCVSDMKVSPAACSPARSLSQRSTSTADAQRVVAFAPPHGEKNINNGSRYAVFTTA
jgi:endonuclease YncB( thermonuclease family)